MKLISLLILFAACLGQSRWWLANIEHRGISPFGPTGNYEIFRNVKNYGVKGDGNTDDYNAINQAISAGGRCGQNCYTSTYPAIIYFPPGTYVVSRPIVPYYYTQIIGDAIEFPTIKASASFNGMAVFDCNPYGNGGNNWWINQQNFFKQIRNLIIDLTAVPVNKGTGIHWQVAQATHLQNLVFNMKVQQNDGNKQQGIFDENGSGGFMSDIVFNGGGVAAAFGNQQFTSRNLTFNQCYHAIQMIWDWSWVFVGLYINNCDVGIDMRNDGIGSIEVVDGVFNGVRLGIQTMWSQNVNPISVATIIIDNVDFTNCDVAVQSTSGTNLLAGGGLVTTYVQGNQYSVDSEVNANGKATRTRAAGIINPAPKKPAVLLGSNNRLVQRGKPQYENVAVGDVLSTRANGVKGDGKTDDTQAIQALLNQASQKGGNTLVYFDHGAYVITNTIEVPSNVRITGECWPLLLASGTKFQDQNNPIPVFRVGRASGEAGNVEISDFCFTTQTQAPGAVLIEWNVKQTTPGGAGIWDVHARLGSTAGSNVNNGQTAAHTCIRVTTDATIYMENTWWWLSDHPFDTGSGNTFYNGRGILIESQGPCWLYGTAPEHHVLYNYQLRNAKNIFIGFAQVETPYFQDTPDSLTPFTPNPTWGDPTFADCGNTDRCKKAWSLRIVNSSDVYIYGAGFYSFFDDNNESCLDSKSCQYRIAEVDADSKNVWIFSLSTIGTVQMLSYTKNGKAAFIDQADNTDSFASTFALYRQ